VLLDLNGLVAALAWMFWPTMMMGSSTNWRKLLDTHATMIVRLCEETAEGRLINAMPAKM